MANPLPPSVGQVAPDFATADAAGGTFKLAERCAEGPLLLVFYRGHW